MSTTKPILTDSTGVSISEALVNPSESIVTQTVGTKNYENNEVLTTVKDSMKTAAYKSSDITDASMIDRFGGYTPSTYVLVNEANKKIKDLRSSDCTTVTIDSSTKFTAPTDGFLYICITSPSSDKDIVFDRVNMSDNTIVLSSFSLKTSNSKLTKIIPLKAEDTVSYNKYFSESEVTAVCKFLPFYYG